MASLAIGALAVFTCPPERSTSAAERATVLRIEAVKNRIRLNGYPAVMIAW